MGFHIFQPDQHLPHIGDRHIAVFGKKYGFHFRFCFFLLFLRGKLYFDSEHGFTDFSQRPNLLFLQSFWQHLHTLPKIAHVFLQQKSVAEATPKNAWLPGYHAKFSIQHRYAKSEACIFTKK